MPGITDYVVALAKLVTNELAIDIHEWASELDYDTYRLMLRGGCAQG